METLHRDFDGMARTSGHADIAGGGRGGGSSSGAGIGAAISWIALALAFVGTIWFVSSPEAISWLNGLGGQSQQPQF